VDKLKKILLFLSAVVYLFLSTGVTLLKTHCLCSDSTSISFYSNSESCHESISDHSCCEEDIPLENPGTGPIDHDCGCDEPMVTYLKLTHHLGDGSYLQYPGANKISLIHCSTSLLIEVINTSSKTDLYPDYLPPENSLYGRSLITFLNQRKIALTA